VDTVLDTTNIGQSKITRELQLTGENGSNEIKFFLEEPVEFDKNEGTPQKRIYFLFKQCKHIFLSFSKNWNEQKFNKDFPEYDSFMNELNPIEDPKKKAVKRQDLPGLISEYNDTNNNNFIDRFITKLISLVDSLKSPISNKIFISLWISILVKSISDVSLCGSLVNLIPDIYREIEGTLTRLQQIANIKNSRDLQDHKKVEMILKGNLNLTYFSSDTITGSGATNIVKLLEYPIQILYSTKRSGITTQTIILQKNVISTLSIILSYIGNGPDKFVELRQKLNNDNGVTTFLTKITKYFFLFYENLKPDFLDVIGIQEKIQKVFDDLFLYQNSNKIDDNLENNKTQLYTLIFNISNIPEFIPCLEKITEILIKPEEEQFIVNRWTYHLSNDIFKYMFPLSEELFTQGQPMWGNKTLKDVTSIEEILTATYDAMYGHDFPFDFIKKLGSKFLIAINSTDTYDMSGIVDHKKIEKACITQTVVMNDYSTLNQHGDKFSIILNNSKNCYLTTDKDSMYFRSSQIPWNITLSPLFKQKLYSSVDFVSGEPALSSLLVEQVNYIKTLSGKGVYVFDIANDSVRQDNIAKISNTIDADTNYNEIFNPCSLFDGAAPYGGKPIYFLGPYRTDYTININSNDKKKNQASTNKIQFSIITKTTETAKALTENWIENRIDETKEIKFQVNNVSIDDLTPSLIQDNKIEIYKTNVIKFNEIWGTILNSSNKLSNDTKQEVVDTFRKIIGNIKKVNTTTEQSEQQRARRNQSVIETNYFDNNEQFNNDTINGFISELEINKILQNQKMFKTLMDYYAEKITRNPDHEVYQTSIKDFLKILEMSIRKTIIENPNGIFKELPSVNDIINKDQEEVSEDPEQEEFRKTLKYFTNKLIVKQTVSIQQEQAREKERLKAREQSRSVDPTLEKSIQQNINYESERNTTTAIDNPNITPIQETGTATQSTLQISGPSFSPDSQEEVATQHDIEVTPPISPSSELTKQPKERLITRESRERLHRMQEEKSVASSTTSIPSEGPVNPKKTQPKVRESRSSILRASAAADKRKRETGGSNNKMTSKNYKKSNNNYSIKNKQLVSKNKSIKHNKHNKRKHTKTYKRN
jgi:hypothetical protein